MPTPLTKPDTQSVERRRGQVAAIRSKKDTLQEDEEHFLTQCEDYLSRGPLPTAEYGSRLEDMWRRHK